MSTVILNSNTSLIASKMVPIVKPSHAFAMAGVSNCRLIPEYWKKSQQLRQVDCECKYNNIKRVPED